MQSSALSRSLLPPEEEPAELARFRAEWLAELKKRKAEDAAGSQTAPPNFEVNLKAESSSSSGIHAPSVAVPQDTPGPSTQTISGTPAALTYVSPAAVRGGSAALPPVLGTALNIYRRAVEHEQQSELDNALLLYRQAFRMVIYILALKNIRLTTIICRILM